MATRLERSLAALDDPAHRSVLTALRRGIEKESLRVLPNGALSPRPHPAALGSPLTHPHITTDFSEAQLELITGVHDSIDACLAELTEIHQFVHAHLDFELLWPASMPCILGADEDIPVGRFGSSNMGRAKTVYRLGLGVRYGRLMQTISGIHYNFSAPDALWPVLASAWDVKPGPDFRSDAYFGLIRNFRRHSWLLLYLFGASPTLCKSFVKNRNHDLPLVSFDEGSVYLPHATALRMGRLGYQSDAQSSVHVSYNDLDQYTVSLRDALTQRYPPYEKLGVKVDGEYRQLNTNLLQIENEFYGTVRPKRRTQRGERPLTALHERGVEYVEVRCLDLNPFMPLGIDAETSRFIEVFLLHCLLSDSAPDSPEESARLLANHQRVVEEGRKPGAQLERDGGRVALTDWARELIAACRPIAAMLDRTHGVDGYTAACVAQQARVDDAEQTPSAQILATMRAEQAPFAQFAATRARDHKAHFQHLEMDPARRAELHALAQASLQRQSELEAADTVGFDEFLASYLNVPDLRPVS